MNRKVKRSIEHNEKALTSIVQRMLIRRLKQLGIDFIRKGDKIISTRNKDVETLYNRTMMDVMVDFERVGGKLSLLKRFYNMK